MLFRSRPGESVRIIIPPSPKRDLVGENIPLKIVFEDDVLLVVDKPAGMVVHPAPGNWSGTLVNALVGRSADLSGEQTDRAGIVHRLDKETSGLLIVAKTEKAHRAVSAAIAARRVKRRYAVLIWGHLKIDALTIDRPVARDPRDRKRMAIVSSGRQARTDLFRLARFDSGDLLRAELHTGRTHQIRVHLASIGHPVVGDDTYGGGGGRKVAGLPPKRHFLHAAWLQFNHPITGVPMDLRSPLPSELGASLRSMAGEFEIEADALAQFGFYG